MAPPVAEVEAEDDLAVHVEVAGWDETEPRVEGGGSVIGHDVAGEQLGGAFAADEIGNEPDDLGSVREGARTSEPALAPSL